MPSVRREYRARIDFRKVGKFARPNVREAIARAQIENKDLALRMVKATAQARIADDREPPNSRTRRGRDMVRSYQGNIIEGGRTFSITNPTPQAAWFEFGVRPHVINPGRKGVLSWQPKGGPRVYTRKPVHHPGQRAQYPVRQTMGILSRRFEQNVANAISKALR
jgi:hypothetical protein